MSQSGATRSRSAGRVVIAVALLAAGLSFQSASVSADQPPVCGMGGTPAVVALADPTFYVDSSAGLDATYAGYTVRAGAAPETGLWLGLGDFTGGSVGLAPGQPATVALPNVAAGASASAYLLLRASGATEAPQTHSVTLYRGHPGAGDVVCRRTFTYNVVYEAIKALANKVTSVTSSTPATASIGDAVTVTVNGKTGTLGAGPASDPGVLSYAPNALSSFPAGAWRLERTTMTISPDGVAPARTYTNRLYLSGASGPDRPYTAEYVFRAIGPAASTSGVQPVQYIASGTQVKHTDIGGSVAGALPAVSKEANVHLAKTASASVLPASGGAVTYTVRATNLGGAGATLDRLVDTLPAGAAYTAGTTTVGGRPVADPHAGGRQLTWSGPIEIPAGGAVDLVYAAVLPATPGPRLNTAVAYYGTAQIDASRDVTVSDPATTTVTVLDAQGSARAVDDTVTTTAGTAVLVGVLANDSSTGGFPLTVQAAGTPSNGTAAVRPGGMVAYTPAAGFAGSDSFTYTVSDGYSTATATVRVTVNPVARNDTYVINRSTTLTGTTVLANDACTGCSVSLVTGPAAGTLTLATSGAFTYVAPNQNQTVTFTYRATAPGGTSATATATIYVNAAGPDYGTTPYATAVTLPVTANDTCPGGGNCNISTGTVAPTRGTVAYSGVSIVYTPNAGFWGLDSFNYNLNGGAGATVTVLTAPPAAAMRTTFETAVTASLSAPAFTGATTVSCPGCVYAVASSPANGRLAVGATTGEVTYTPDPSFAGADSFAYSVTDPASGLTVTGSVAVVVGPEAADDTVTTLAGSDVTVPVLANDSCPGTCTVALVAGSGPSTGTVTLNGDRTVTYAGAPAHDIGTITFRYRVTSSLASGVSATATVTVNVAGAVADQTTTSPGAAVTVDVQANDPCTGCVVTAVSPPGAGTAAVEADGRVTYRAPAGFSGTVTFTYDVSKNGRTTSAAVTVTVLPRAVDDRYAAPAGDPLVVDPRSNDLCVACVITAVTAPDGGGSAVVASGGTGVNYTPGVGPGGTERFDYTLQDGSGNTTTATVVVTVNAPPSAGDDTAATDAETPVVVAVLANDSCTGCVPEPAADPAHGTVSFRADGAAQYAPAAGFTGRDSFRYLVVDPATGLAAEATVTVTVRPTAADDRAATSRGTAVSVDVQANDVCASCSISVTEGPSSGGVTVVGATLRYTPDAGFEGTDDLRYRLTDPTTGEHAEALLVVTVSDAAPDVATTAFGTAVDVNVLANDPCPGCGLTGVAEPGNGTAAVVGGVVRYTPSAGFWGLDRFTYEASNGGVANTGSVTVLVAPPARHVTTGTNTPVSGSLLGTAPCAGCLFTVVSPPASGDVELDESGTWRYTPLPDANPDDVVTYRVLDPASGVGVTATLTISVRPTQVTVVVRVVNDSGGTASAADFPVTVNGTAVAAGVATLFPAGATYTVSQTVADGYAGTGLACTDDGADAGHPFVLGAGRHVVCTFTNDDLSTTPAVSLSKTAGPPVDANGSGRVDAGDTVTYSYVVANTGGVPLTGLVVTDDRIPAGVCTVATLAPAAGTTCTAEYTVTQADVDAGGVTNVAHVAGDAGAGTVSATDSVTVTLARVDAVAVRTTVTGRDDADSSGGDTPGDLVRFRVLATNTGTTTLSGAVVTESLTSTSEACATLAPGETCAATAGHRITQADLDAGSVTDTGSVTATGPGGAVQASDAATAALDAPPATLSIAKSVESEVDADRSGTRTTGDVLHYRVVATNVGGRTARNVTVVDELTADEARCPSVAPGASCSLTASHTLTADEAVAGRVVNVAAASGDATGPVSTRLESSVTRRDGLSVQVALERLDLGAATPVGRADAGDRARYRYTVRNTGEGPLRRVALAGPLAGQATCPGTTLAAGASMTCTLDHELTQADVDAGLLDAGAGATGVDADDRTVSGAAALTTGLPASPALALAKTVAAGSGCAGATDTAEVRRGGLVTWCFSVANNGNVTLRDVVVDDPPLGIRLAAGPLAPGERATLSHRATVQDGFTNKATASGAHGGTATSAGDTAAVATTSPATHTVDGVVWFDADADGVRDDAEPLLPGATLELRQAVRVTAASTGAFRATAASTGEPSAVGASTVSGPDGRYALRGVAAGAYTLVARAAGLPSSWDSDGRSDWTVALVVVDSDVAADFATTPSGAIGGRITQRVTGASVAGALVRCTWAGLDGVPGTDDDVPFRAVAGSDGRYTVAAAPPGGFSCAATDPVTGEQDVFEATVVAGAAATADGVLGARDAGSASPPAPPAPAAPAPGGSLPRTGIRPGFVVVGVALLIAGIPLSVVNRPKGKTDGDPLP